MTRAWLSSSIAALAVTALVAAQTPQTPQQPTFRAGATIVPVDVRVFDGKGKPVTNLTREDFTVWEDDVPQEIALFAATALTPAVPDLKNNRAGGPPAEGQPKFVVVNGDGAMPNPFMNLNGTPAFVKNLSEPTTTVATTDPATARPIDQGPESIGPRNVGQPPDAIARKSFATIGMNVAQTDRAVEKLYTAIDQLKHDDGEKHIIFMANTPPTFDRAEDIEALAKAANDARVVIDVVQTGACGGCWGVLDMERLAKLTGGVPGIYASPGKVQDEILKANSFEYQLGYYPKNTTMDSRFRTIKVKVNRPGLEVSYRTGYYARKPALVMDPDTRKRYNRVSGALRSSIPISQLKISATATPYSEGETRGVNAHISIDAAGLALRQENGMYVGTIDVVVLAANARDALVGRSWNAVDLQLTEAQYQQALANGLPLDQKVPVTASPSNVKVVVYDPKSDRLGSVMLPVKR